MVLVIKIQAEQKQESRPSYNNNRVLFYGLVIRSTTMPTLRGVEEEEPTSEEHKKKVSSTSSAAAAASTGSHSSSSTSGRVNIQATYQWELLFHTTSKKLLFTALCLLWNTEKKK